MTTTENLLSLGKIDYTGAAGAPVLRAMESRDTFEPSGLPACPLFP
jgi:hypothetical protein